MLRKFFLILLAMLVTVTPVFAVDWSQYESIRDNIRLEGYQSMPGYIAFGDGDGNILGYIWMSPGKGLVWCSTTTGTSYKATIAQQNSAGSGGSGRINLRTDKLSDEYGVPISREFTGSIADGVKY